VREHICLLAQVSNTNPNRNYLFATNVSYCTVFYIQLPHTCQIRAFISVVSPVAVSCIYSSFYANIGITSTQYYVVRILRNEI